MVERGVFATFHHGIEAKKWLDWMSNPVSHRLISLNLEKGDLLTISGLYRLSSFNQQSAFGDLICLGGGAGMVQCDLIYMYTFSNTLKTHRKAKPIGMVVV